MPDHGVTRRLAVRHLSPDCRRMLDLAGDLVSVEETEDDPIYLVARIPGQSG